MRRPVSKEPAEMTTAELLDEVSGYTTRYTGIRHKGQLFRTYATLVEELLRRLGHGAEEIVHVEYAPVANGCVLEHLAISEPDQPTNYGRLPVASRLVTPWRIP